MTIKKTLAKLKELGCKARWSSDWQEYRVTLPNLSASREEAIAYYTSDPEDALDTGAAMVRVIIDPKPVKDSSWQPADDLIDETECMSTDEYITQLEIEA